MWRAITTRKLPWIVPRLIPVAAVVFGVSCSTDPDTEPTADDLKYGAFDVCTQFVKDRLKSPGTAEFPNEFEDDGEVVTTNVGDVYTVQSHVDSQNTFGGVVQTAFTCEVRHVDGTQWKLVDLQLAER
jgi:hypothetical protein